MKSFSRIFARRCVVSYFLLCVFLLFCILRLSTVATGNYAAVQSTQNTVCLDLYRPRGTIYDCNGNPLTNRTTEVRAALSPTVANRRLLKEVLSEAAYRAVEEQSDAGEPIVCTLPERIQTDGMLCQRVTVPHTARQSAVHLIGVINAEGHGISGLEYAFDNLLYSEPTQAAFRVNGIGQVLAGEPIELQETANGNAVYTTLDQTVQTALEQATEDLTCGAALLCDTEGNIRAAVSRPTFDSTDLAKTVEQKNAPQMNRVFTPYSVGSVFKPCVAAAGLENGIGNETFICKGSMTIGGRVFGCHEANGHGKQQLGDALQNSCNIYFCQYASAIGVKPIRRMAQMLNFGSAIRLGDDFFSARGNLPSEGELQGKAAVFNLSIGQGTQLLSPLSMCTLYSAIAQDGSYILPHLVTGFRKDGEDEKIEPPAPTRAFSPQTAIRLRKALRRVVTDGTGKAAKAESCTVAGKTATAQTGRYENGKEVTVGWFCGFFPADDPQYVGVVTVENANGTAAAALFAKMVDTVMKTKNASQP